MSKKLSGLTAVVTGAGSGIGLAVAQSLHGFGVRVLNINVIGISRISTAAMPFLRKSSSVTIVNTCSIAATVA